MTIFQTGLVYVIQKHSTWLVSELDPLHGEEGSGHAPTFELSRGRNADLTNDCHWSPWHHGNGFLQAFTCSLSLTARYGKSLCYALFLVTVWQKLRGAMSRTVAIVCMVSVNYPRIIAVCGDNLNVGTYPDPSSSHNERSGPRVQKRLQWWLSC